MRTIFLTGTALAVVFIAANWAIRLLNQPSDASVAAGYLLLLGLVSAAAGIGSWLLRRRS